MKQAITIFELQLEMKCLLLETPDNCTDAMESLKKIPANNDEEKQMIQDTRGIIFNRGQQLRLDQHDKTTINH